MKVVPDFFNQVLFVVDFDQEVLQLYELSVTLLAVEGQNRDTVGHLEPIAVEAVVDNGDVLQLPPPEYPQVLDQDLLFGLEAGVPEDPLADVLLFRVEEVDHLVGVGLVGSGEDDDLVDFAQVPDDVLGEGSDDEPSLLARLRGSLTVTTDPSEPLMSILILADLAACTEQWTRVSSRSNISVFFPGGVRANAYPICSLGGK